MRIKSTEVKVTYKCPKNDFLYTQSIIKNKTYYDDGTTFKYPIPETIFIVECPCGRQHKISTEIDF